MLNSIPGTPVPTPNWGSLFAPGSYRFRMGLRPGRLDDFFRSTELNAQLLLQRRHWLRAEPARYSCWAEDGVELLEEMEFLAANWGLRADPSLVSGPDRLARLGSELEPDFLLLRRAPGIGSRLVAGVVCFPSSWALEEKAGRPLGEIHGVVPGLNRALGSQIDRFLERMQPGDAWERENWGLSADAELNRHPSRGLRGLEAGSKLSTTWVRVEHQILQALPTAGILFGIRLSLHRLDSVAALDPQAGLALARALTSMPEDVAAYKGLGQSRASLAQQLEDLGG